MNTNNALQLARELIDGLGGNTAVARLLKFKDPGTNGARRVSNWRRRGIPGHIRADYPELFQRKPGPTTEPQETPHAQPQ